MFNYLFFERTDLFARRSSKQFAEIVESTILSKYAFEADWVSQTNRLLCYYVVLRSRAVNPACASHSDVEEFLHAGLLYVNKHARKQTNVS